MWRGGRHSLNVQRAGCFPEYWEEVSFARFGANFIYMKIPG